MDPALALTFAVGAGDGGGGGGGGGAVSVTVTTTDAFTLPSEFVALSEYRVVEVGDTDFDPFTLVESPLSVAPVAFVVVHDKVDDLPL